MQLEMKKNNATTKAPAEQIVEEIWLATRRLHSSEAKTYIVLSSLRSKHSIAELFGNESIAPSPYCTF